VFAAPDCPCEGEVLGLHITLKIPGNKRHFWSPWLNVEVEPQPDGSSILHARFSPHPNVWTSFALTYMAMMVVIMIGACFGLSQWWIDQRPTALWAVPAAVGVSACFYIASQIGQKLAHDEMVMLDEFLQKTVEADPAS